EKTYLRVGRELPTEIGGGKGLEAEVVRLKGKARERLDIQSAKKVVHDGVADQHNVRNIVARDVGGKDQLVDQATDLLTDQATKLGFATLGRAEIHTAHHI